MTLSDFLFEITKGLGGKVKPTGEGEYAPKLPFFDVLSGGYGSRIAASLEEAERQRRFEGTESEADRANRMAIAEMAYGKGVRTDDGSLVDPKTGLYIFASPHAIMMAKANGQLIHYSNGDILDPVEGKRYSSTQGGNIPPPKEPPPPEPKVQPSSKSKQDIINRAISEPIMKDWGIIGGYPVRAYLGASNALEGAGESINKNIINKFSDAVKTLVGERGFEALNQGSPGINPITGMPMPRIQPSIESVTTPEYRTYPGASGALRTGPTTPEELEQYRIMLELLKRNNMWPNVR